MPKLTGTHSKARYMFKVHRWHVRECDVEYLMKKLPKRAVAFTKHCKKRQREKNFRVTLEEITQLLTYNNLLDIQVGFDGKVTYVYRGNLGRAYDVAFVIDTQGRVISTWANHKKDNHKTLDERIYKKYINLREWL